jgi:adenylate cyclase
VVKYILVNRALHMVLLLLFLAGALYMRGQDYNWVKSLRYLAFDSYNQFYPRESSNQVVIADIDETSLRDDKLGQWPWPRTDVARLVSSLKALGAKAIVFDIVFAEEDRTSPSVLLKKIPQESITPDVKATLESLSDHDDILAKAFSDAGNVVTGFVWSGSFEATRHSPALSKPIMLGKGLDGLKDTLYTAPGVTTNLTKLERASAGNGSFGQHPDVDGIIRRVPLLFTVKEGGGKIYPSLALEALRVAEDPKNPNKIRTLKEAELSPLSFPYLLKRGKYEIPLDKDAVFYIHFSPYDEEKYIPAWKIIDRSIEPSKIEGKIVLVGTSSIGLKDVRSTPLDLYIPGVDVHRNIIEQVMDGRFLLRPMLMEGAELIFTAVVALAAVLLAPFVNALLLGLLTILLIISVNFFSFWAFASRGMLIDPVYPSATILLVFFLAALLTYIRTEIERRSVKQAFGLYISQDYMKELTKDPSRLRLGGEIRPITVMFTDIRNFTGIAENLGPDELIQLMNDFLTPMSDRVMSHRGTIDKYMGDAMMAFWNAPLDDPEHPRNACLAALAMKTALEPVNQRLVENARQRGESPILLKAGIGINSGAGAVGNMGSRQRFAYSVLGDTVNLASRLEGQTKVYGVDIIIGENTFEGIPDFAALELDLLRVKGKERPIRVYALLDSMKSPEFLALEPLHSQMLQAYRNQEWDKALDLIGEGERVGLSEMKKYYTLMQERIIEARSGPPISGWDGVYTAQSK